MAYKTVAFVAKEQLPALPPPPSTTGPMGWLKENLFSSIADTVMTIIALILVVWLIDNIIVWCFLNGVWNADSLRGCREIWAADGGSGLYHSLTGQIWEAIFGASETKGGHGAPGACWAVIVERFDQFIYGFYPVEGRWRPNLAFIFMLVAIAYVLFDKMPMRKAGLIFAGLMPILGYWLIWGGSIWVVPLIVITAVLAIAVYRAVTSDIDPTIKTVVAGVLAAVVGLFAAAVANLIFVVFDDIFLSGDNVTSLLDFDALQNAGTGLIFSAVIPLAIGAAGAAYVFGAFRKGSTGAAIAAAAIVAVAWLGGVLAPLDGVLTDNIGHFGLEKVESASIGGFLLGIIIGVAGIVLSLPIGILLALGRRSGMIFIQTISVVFIEFIRGVPLITLLFVASAVLAYFFPPGSNLDLILRVVIMVTLFSSAYMAEVVRGGLAALPQGQYEAGDSLGLNYWQSMRLIILPQALKISIPNIVSSFIGLFKDTTLVVVIGLLDPVGLIGTIRAAPEWNGLVWEFYVFVGLFFFIACFGMSRYSMYLERKLATDHR